MSPRKSYNPKKTENVLDIEKTLQSKTDRHFTKKKARGLSDYEDLIGSQERVISEAKNLLQEGLTPAVKTLLDVISNTPDHLSKEEYASKKLKLEAAKHAMKLNGLETEQHLVASVDKDQIFTPLIISRG